MRLILQASGFGRVVGAGRIVTINNLHNTMSIWDGWQGVVLGRRVVGGLGSPNHLCLPFLLGTYRRSGQLYLSQDTVMSDSRRRARALYAASVGRS